ncbi:uncharacterized protein LOC131614098 [Vicia villosa]|uniref:uncharacterized protein LOC131614098 n=1 Tax=Vicia villosa TaxID=3911 RepID=UPI00273CE043|nr:uncharacterized protein LOC131614098 [Vicia villosa]
MTSILDDDIVQIPGMYAVTDDLAIAPLTPVLALGLLNRFKTPLTDLKEKVVIIRDKEEDKAIWSRFLLVRYHNPKIKVLALSKDLLNRDDSRWWRDIVLNDFKEDELGEGFTDWVSCEFKNGYNTLFWHSCWLIDQPLRVSFPHLFVRTINKLCAVSDIVSWNNGVILWNLESIFGTDVSLSPAPNAFNQFPSVMSTVVVEELRDLKALLQGVVPDNLAKDEFRWNLTSNADFKLSSVSILVSNAKELAWSLPIINMLDIIRKITIPAKIKILTWRFFINPLPLKVQLVNRGVSNFTSIDCIFCSTHPESLEHLFYHCHVTKAVWKRIYTWLDDEVKISLEEFKSFGSIQEKKKNINIKATLNTIWIALIWCTWKMRNTIIFDNGLFNFDEVISNIMFFSWRWSCNREPHSRISFYDWYKLPLLCNKTH